MNNEIDITKLIELGWQPIVPSELTETDKLKNVYTLDGAMIGTIYEGMKIPNSRGVVVFTNNGDRTVYEGERLLQLSLTPPTIEVSLVALGFEITTSNVFFSLQICDTDSYSCQIQAEKRGNEWKYVIEQNEFDGKKWRGIMFPNPPNIKSIPDLKKAIECLNFLFVER